MNMDIEDMSQTKYINIVTMAIMLTHLRNILIYYFEHHLNYVKIISRLRIKKLSQINLLKFDDSFRPYQ